MNSAAGPAFPFNENWRCEAFVPPDERWCAFQKDLSAHLSSLGPAPVRIAWDTSKPEIIEVLLAVRATALFLLSGFAA